METFMKVYEACLRRAVEAYPQDYRFGQDGVPAVVNKMREAIRGGSYNKDSASFKWACKELKIAHTYKAIEKFIANHE